MSGDKNITLQVDLDEEVSIPKCEDGGDFYTIIVHPFGVKSEIMRPFFNYVVKAHADYRLEDHEDAPEAYIVNLPWLYDDYPEGFDPFGAAHTILHAIAETKPDPICATLLLEKATPDAFWKFLPSLPPCIEEITVGLCEVDSVPPAVWESLPRLQKIEVYTSRTKDGKIGPEVIFERPKASHPRDDEHEAADKRARTEVVDFATSAAKAFVVLPDDDDDPLAETYSIVLDPEEEDEFVFRAIAHEKIPKEGAHKLLGCNFERVRISKDMRKFFREYAFVDEEGKMRNGAKFNNNASALTGMTLRDPLFGRVVFVKK